MTDERLSSVCLASVDPANNRYRRYRLSIQPTLWGELALVRWWGRRGGTGRQQVSLYAYATAAQTMFQRLLQLRSRHGYQRLQSSSSGPCLQAAGTSISV